MLNLASDADFNGDILRGLRSRCPGVDVVRVQDVGLRTAVDPIILNWAAAENRILLTHDRATMTHFAYERIRSGLIMPGVLVVLNEQPFGPLIDDLILIVQCSTPEEWQDRVDYVPL